MKYVAVKHQPDNDISYWFEVPCNLEDAVAVGKDVLCNTRRGDMTGYIVSIMDGVPEDVAVRIIGNRFPLKNILPKSEPWIKSLKFSNGRTDIAIGTIANTTHTNTADHKIPTAPPKTLSHCFKIGNFTT